MFNRVHFATEVVEWADKFWRIMECVLLFYLSLRLVLLRLGQWFCLNTFLNLIKFCSDMVNSRVKSTTWIDRNRIRILSEWLRNRLLYNWTWRNIEIDNTTRCIVTHNTKWKPLMCGVYLFRYFLVGHAI